MTKSWMEELGVLVPGGEVISKYAWLTETEKQFILFVGLHGDDGLHKAAFEKYKRDQLKANKENDSTALTRILGTSLLHWEKDQRGTARFLCLSEEGKDLSKILIRQAKQQNRR